MATSKKLPIAIVGIGCRLPGGASNPDKFWDLLMSKSDAIVGVPASRWNIRKFLNAEQGYSRNDKIATDQGGFLVEDISTFDPEFFKISPREAKSTDPQQRLLMEVSFEAIEDAGFLLNDLAGSMAGVYIGGFTFDYTSLQMDRESRHLINSSVAIGGMQTMLSNKLSYLYDLRGPSMTIDTACSSSLVAVHLACQGIWNGECELAMAGGVNVMLNPVVSIVMSAGKFLSKDGRCRAFDKDASGYVRGEGAAVVWLKNMDKAIADGDRIYAVITATGLNQDGKTNGITMPSYEAQRMLVRSVYEEGGIDINDLHYIEAHGTGTQAGDPVEFQALNSVLVEKGYRHEKCLLGSAKTNVGHLEAGAGVVGLIKAALCLRNRMVPPNLHFHVPNPELHYEESKLRIPCEAQPLPQGKRLFAGVNSFGYGGTNAHVLLGEYQPPKAAGKPAQECGADENFFIFPLSAANKESLRQMAGDYSNYLDTTDEDLGTILFSAIRRRSPLRYNLAVAATSRSELLDKLKRFASGEHVGGVSVNERSHEAIKTAFVFTGMGPQWWKMGRELLKQEPVFRSALEELDRIFRTIASWSVLAELEKDEHVSIIKRTDIAQPANFFIQYGLIALLNSYGVKADAFVGHSLGEISSGFFSGALSLEDALTICYHRSRLQGTRAGTGSMLAIGLRKAELQALLTEHPEVSIAAENSGISITVAGEQDAIAILSEELSAMGIFNKVLDVEVPYHCHLMDPIKEQFLAALRTIAPVPPVLPLYSSVTGAKLESAPDSRHWWRNVREPVQFGAAIKQLAAGGYNLFIEIGPQPVLKTAISECLDEVSRSGAQLHFMHRQQRERAYFYSQLAALYALGYPVGLDGFGTKGAMANLPKYRWQRSAFWNEGRAFQQDRVGGDGNLFLHQRVNSPSPAYEAEVNGGLFAFLNDHKIQGKPVFPGAGYIAAAIALCEKEVMADGQQGLTLEDIEFHQLLMLDKRQGIYLHSAFLPRTSSFTIHSRVEDGLAGQWQLRAGGRISLTPLQHPVSVIDLGEWRERCRDMVEIPLFYAKLERMGLEYGPLFHGVRSLRRSGNELLAEIEAPEGLEDDPYFIHPVLLDACFQALAANYPERKVVPVGIRRVICTRPPGRRFFCAAVTAAMRGSEMTADLKICNEKGEVLVSIEGFRCQEAAFGVTKTAAELKDLLCSPEWIEIEETAGSEMGPAEMLVCCPDPEMCTVIRDQLVADKRVVRLPGPVMRKENGYDPTAPLHIVYVPVVKPAAEGAITAGDCYNPVGGLTDLLQTLSRPRTSKTKIDIVTFDTQKVVEEDKCNNLLLFSLWGFGHVLANEFSGYSVRHIDLSGDAAKGRELSEAGCILLARTVCSEWGETDIAVRAGKVYAIRMKKAGSGFDDDDARLNVNTADYVLNASFTAGGGIASLHYKEAPRPDPREDEVEIRVSDASINFKDFLKVSGLISKKALEQTFFDRSVGMDCAGTVVRAGSKVKGLQPGDAVIALAPEGSFRTYVRAGQDMVFRRPAALEGHYPSHVLTVFLTVLRCLRDIAGLKKGENILIHNASGGVGLAAIQYAQYVGAEVFATTGRPAKAEYLRLQGMQHVYSVKDLEFVTGILQDTGGYGVDVVISAQPGEILHQSLALLAPYGRYIEIGKKDIIDNTGLPLQFFNKNLSFTSVDLDRILKDKPGLVHDYFLELCDYFEKGIFSPLPVKAFPAGQIKEAFGWVEKGNHIGKVVVDMSDPEVELVPDGNFIRHLSGGSCLITGGTRGLGLELAKWLAASGARSIVLASRSGLERETAEEITAYFQKMGTTLQVMEADISSYADTVRVITAINDSLPPLRTIIHGAMVLDDGLVTDLSQDRFLKVMRPKVDGALNLHRATAGMHIDHFVSLSSISSLIGNTGQGNYVAANAFLDAFARYRRGKGLPATTVNLGLLLETGVLQRDPVLQALLQNAGIRGFNNKEVLDGFSFVMRCRQPQIGFFDVDWTLLAANHKTAGTLSLFKDFIAEYAIRGSAKGQQEEWLRSLIEMEPRDRHSGVVKILVSNLSEILKMPENNINPDRGINLLGIDSVMVVELISAISRKFGISMSPMEFLSGPTVNDLSSSLLSRLVG